jgi:tetratricopeptide (TPR) repeat protein
LPPAMRARSAFSLLDDPVRAVRIEAASVLADIPPGQLPEAQKALLDQATAEYIEAQQAMAERPEAQANLGNLYTAQGNTALAVAAYNTAIELNPVFTPGYVNLSDLYRSQGDEQAAEQVLRRALKELSGNADIHYVLGLSLVRQQRNKEAVDELRLATNSAPENPRYVYVYAVALNSIKQPQEAVLVLHGAHQKFPTHTDILNALVAFHRDMGNQQAMQIYAEKLKALSP